MTLPSPSRTVYLPIGQLLSGTENRWPFKAPGDTLPFTLDASNFLADAGGDTIVPGSVTIVSSPGDLIFSGATITATSATFMIGGGTATSPVTDYAVTVAFSTVRGLSVSRDIWLRVQPDSPNSTYGTDLIIASGPPGISVTNVSIDAVNEALVFSFTSGPPQRVSLTALAEALSPAITANVTATVEQSITALADSIPGQVTSGIAGYFSSEQTTSPVD